MTPLEFLEKQLNNFVQKYQEAEFKIERDEYDGTYYIEVAPDEMFFTNKDFINTEKEIRDVFFEKYPNDDLAFMTGDDTFPIKKPLSIVSGKNFNRLKATYSF